MKRIIDDEEESKQIVTTLDRSEIITPIFTCEKFRHADTGLLFKAPVSYIDSETQNSDRITYYESQLKSAYGIKMADANKPIGDKVKRWKSRKLENWTPKVSSASFNLKDFIPSRNRSGYNASGTSGSTNFTNPTYLDAKGAYYDGTNLIYILFYSEELQGLYISAYDLGAKDFYQIKFLGKLYTDDRLQHNAYPGEQVASATVYLQTNKKLSWYVKGNIANLWIVEHDCVTFSGEVKHYVCFKKNICQEITNASLFSINGSAYLAGLEAYNNKTTVFCTNKNINKHWPCLQTSRKRPLIGFLDGNIYHIGGLVNATDPLVEVHRISERSDNEDMDDYRPMQQISYPRNTFVMNEGENQAISEDKCVYCQFGHTMYIFDDVLFSNEEYFKYGLLDNKWSVLRFPAGIEPPFEIDSRVAVSTGEELYLFFFSSRDGKLNFKLLCMSEI